MAVTFRVEDDLVVGELVFNIYDVLEYHINQNSW